MIIAATGHRPDKLGGYDERTFGALKFLAECYIKLNLTPDPRTRIEAGISGMALGWDMAWAEALIELEVPLIAAIPFVGQEQRWPDASQERYRRILGAADRVEIICTGGYAAYKMQARNEWMVDKADRIVALWDGSAGGTRNCVAYAEECKVPIDNLWDQWEG